MVHIGNVWQLLTIKDPLKDRVRQADFLASHDRATGASGAWTEGRAAADSRIRQRSRAACNKVAHGRKQAPKALQYIARPTHREFLEELAICARSLKK